MRLCFLEGSSCKVGRYGVLKLSCFMLLSLFMVQSGLRAQSPFSSSKSSLLLSNGLSGASQAWIELSVSSSLNANYRLVMPRTVGSLNQVLKVNAISGSNDSLTFTTPTGLNGAGNSGSVAYWSASGSLLYDTLFCWNNSTSDLGAGTSSPTAQVHSVVQAAGAAIDSLVAANRSILAQNTTTSGGIGVQFIALNSAGSTRTVNLGMNPTFMADKGAFGAIPAGITEGGFFFDATGGNVNIGNQLSGTSIVNKLSISGNSSVGVSYREVAAPTNGAIILGKVGIGTSSSLTQMLTVYNGSTTGTYTTSGWQHSSDARLKTNIRPLENCLQTIRRIHGVRFNWKQLPSCDDQIGFIAQDLDTVLPEVVQRSSSGEYSLSQSNLVATHNEALRQLSKRVKSVESAVELHQPSVQVVRPQRVSNSNNTIHNSQYRMNAPLAAQHRWKVEFVIQSTDANHKPKLHFKHSSPLPFSYAIEELGFDTKRLKTVDVETGEFNYTHLGGVATIRIQTIVDALPHDHSIELLIDDLCSSQIQTSTPHCFAIIEALPN